jgi:hypothetical protein
VNQLRPESSTPTPHITPKKTRFRIEKLEERIAPGAMVFDTVTGHIIITPSENIHIINNGGGRFRLMDPVTGLVTDIEVEFVD